MCIVRFPYDKKCLLKEAVSVHNRRLWHKNKVFMNKNYIMQTL